MRRDMIAIGLVIMTSKIDLGKIERRVNAFYALCERIVLRTLVFGCFVAEVARFVGWLFR